MTPEYEAMLGQQMKWLAVEEMKSRSKRSGDTFGSIKSSMPRKLQREDSRIKRELLMQALTNEWVSTKDIGQALGMSSGLVGSLARPLRINGLVERIERSNGGGKYALYRLARGGK